jgi:2-methylcitrate dehydratase PrpD
MSFALEMATRVRALRFEDLPPEAVHWARIGILDTVGVTILGSRDAGTRLVSKVGCPGSTGRSLVFGEDRLVAPLDAALVNGMASHALDFDDCNNTFGGHPSVPILPGLFALADEIGVTGRDFLTAYVAGFECECKFSRGLNLYQYMKGWHPTVTLGIFGAAAAAGHLMQLPAEKIATALGVAASMAAGVKANLGTMTKPLHVGQCARNGLFAAQLAAEGFTANPLAFEHKMGYFNLYNGEGNYSIEKILSNWCDPFDIVDPGIAIKQYPCCASTHPAADAVLALVEKHGVKPEDIERIESYTHSRRLEHTNRPAPRSAIDAKFSVQYVIARALTDHCVRQQHFEADAHAEPKVQSLMKRVQAAPYTTEQFPVENHFGAEVRLHLKDGRTLVGKVDRAAGRTSANPLTTAQMKAKFELCVKDIVHPDNVEPLYAAIQDFENLDDVRTVTSCISSRKAARAVA